MITIQAASILALCKAADWKWMMFYYIDGLICISFIRIIVFHIMHTEGTFNANFVWWPSEVHELFPNASSHAFSGHFDHQCNDKHFHTIISRDMPLIGRMFGRQIWWVLWENRPVQGSKQGCTYPTMVGMLSVISNRGVISRKMLEFLVILIPNIWHFFKQSKFYTILKTKNLPIFQTLNRSIFAWLNVIGRIRIRNFYLMLWGINIQIFPLKTATFQITLFQGSHLMGWGAEVRLPVH